MKKSKRYIYAKKLVYDALRKEKYFKKRDKRKYLKFYEYYDWKIYNYQIWKKWDEERYGKLNANIILRKIFRESEIGKYYNKEEIENFVDIAICDEILFHMNRILDDPEGNATIMSDGIPAKQRIIEVKEAIIELEQLDYTRYIFFRSKFKELIGEE